MINVEECLARIENPFELITLAAKHARHLSYGKPSAMVESTHKPTVIALQEISMGLIHEDQIRADEEQYLAPVTQRIQLSPEEIGDYFELIDPKAKELNQFTEVDLENESTEL